MRYVGHAALICMLVGHVLSDVPTLDVPTVANAQGKCDRMCLEGIAEQYLDALVAKEPKSLPAASSVKYTENGQRLMLGDGFWNSVTGRGTYKLHIADQTAGQVVTFSTMREAGTPMIIAVRLKIDGSRRLTEIETLVAHSEGGAKNLEAIGKPRAAFLRETPAAGAAAAR